MLPLTASAALAAAEHATVAALLPCFAPSTPSIGAAAAALAAFHAPALLVHSTLQYVKQPHPSTAVVAALAIQVVASAFLVVAALFALHPFSILLLTAALFIAGIGAALFQAQILNHIASCLSESNFLRDMGVHLSVIETASSLLASGAPVLAALMITHFKTPLLLPFAIYNLAMTVVFSFAVSKISRPLQADLESAGLLESHMPGPTSFSAPMVSNFNNIRRGRQVNITELIIRPCVFAAVLEMIVAAAATSFLLPSLAIHVVGDLNGTILTSATLLAILQMTAFIANATATVMLYPRFGRRAVILGALVLAAFGFHLLGSSHWLSSSLALLSLGANSALVLSLGRLADTADVDILDDSGSISYASFIFTSFGELLGILASGIFHFKFSNFDLAVRMWSRALLAFVCVCLLPDLLVACFSCLNRLTFPVATAVDRPTDDLAASQLLLT